MDEVFFKKISKQEKEMKINRTILTFSVTVKKSENKFFFTVLCLFMIGYRDRPVTIPDNRVTVPLPSRYISVTNIFFSVTNLRTFCYALSRFPKAYLEYRDKP